LLRKNDAVISKSVLIQLTDWLETAVASRKKIRDCDEESREKMQNGLVKLPEWGELGE